MIRTMMASALLTLGAGVALGQTPSQPAENNANTTEPAQETQTQPTAEATPADLNSSTAADQGTAEAAADPPAKPEAKEDVLAAKDSAADKAPKKSKARTKQRCVVKIGQRC